MKKNVTVILPARINSTRCPRKIIRDFHEGMSLFEIMCLKMKGLRYPHAVAVGEDELARIAEKHGVPVIWRTDEEINSRGPLRQVFKCVEKAETSHAMLISPCTPFVATETLNKACDYLCQSEYQSLTSVIKEQNWFFNRHGKPYEPIDVHDMTSNDLCVYALASIFEAFPVDRFLKEGIYYTFKDPADPHLFHVAKTEAIDINTEEEFELAAHMWRYRGGK